MSPPDQFNFTAAQNLPARILFGTSSWTYPGWKGLIYKESYKDEKVFRAKCLAEYAKFPWFRTVGIDSLFYAPPRLSTLKSYAAQIPAQMRWVSKVWEEITIPRYAKHARYGERAGKDNANFLNAELFKERVLTVCEAPEVRPHVGPFVFEFQRFGPEWRREPGLFIEQLDRFLARLPREFQYAVELRTPEIMTVEYIQVLNRHGATHCFNHWSGMPPLKEQMKVAAAASGLGAPFYVARILTPLGVSYDEAVNRFEPYDKLQAPNPEMRADVARLAQRAIQKDVDAFVLVNNRAEGCAPFTIDAIGTSIVAGHT